jgi:nicotinamidase-related amidase
MTLTTLDPKTALVVVDLQEGLRGYSLAHPFDDVVRQSASLAAAFRAHGLPVVLVNVTGRPAGRTEGQGSGATAAAAAADWADIVAELDPQPDDVRVTKRTMGAFHQTSLDAELQARGVTQVVVVGVATSSGVESTARAAHEHGYNVTLATDAMTDRDAVAHQNSIERIFPKIGESGTTAEVIDLLARTR